MTTAFDIKFDQRVDRFRDVEQGLIPPGQLQIPLDWRPTGEHHQASDILKKNAEYPKDIIASAAKLPPLNSNPEDAAMLNGAWQTDGSRHTVGGVMNKEEAQQGKLLCPS